MPGDSSRKGKAVELLVAATCMLESGGELNVLVSYVDDEGVDLVVQRRDRARFLALQVKSRFSTAATISRGNFLADVRKQTFSPRDDYYLLFVVVNAPPARVDLCWLVPSKVLARRVRPNSRDRYRFAASMSVGSGDQWSQYRHSGEQLPSKLLSLL